MPKSGMHGRQWTACGISCGDGAFYYAVADSADRAVKWPALMARGPDFVKTYLL